MKIGDYALISGKTYDWLDDGTRIFAICTSIEIDDSKYSNDRYHFQAIKTNTISFYSNLILFYDEFIQVTDEKTINELNKLMVFK